MKIINKAYKPLLLATTLGAACTASHAQSTDAMDDKFRLAGFATIAYGKALDNSAEVANDGNPNTTFDNNPDDVTYSGINGLTEDGEYRDLNKFGLRLDVDLDDKLSFAAQMLADGRNDYDPEFDWLYASYSILPNFKVSVGKTVAPLYMYSDYLDTSYAYQWITPPHAVYGAGTIKSTEGIRANWRADMGGDWSSDLTVWAGKTDEPLQELKGASVIVDNGLGAAWAVERDWLTLRAVYFAGKTSAEAPAIDDLTQGLNEVLTSLPGLSNADIKDLDAYDDIIWKDEDSSFAGFGIGLDFGSVFFNSEATQVKIDGNNIAVNELNSWYAMLGTRLPGNVSLSITYSEDNDKGNEDIGDIVTDDLLATYGTNGGNPLVDGTLVVMGQEVQSIALNEQVNKSKNYAFNVRWDFHRSAALKFQYMTSTLAAEYNAKRKPDGFIVGMDLVF